MLSTLKSSLKVSLVSLILIFSLTAVSRAHRHSSYFREDGKQVDNPDWMSLLPNNVHLSELSIPGTHESLSRHSGGVVPLDLVKTQSMALKFQLESGIRALDVRCAIVGRSFNIYHGNIYQKESFDGVLSTVVKFLIDHPSETVLMRVKQERTDQPGTFLEIFRQTYWKNVKYQSYIPKGMSLNPTLREMRGKIVILQDFARWQCETPFSKAEFGVCYNSFDIQDQFQVRGNTALYDKWLAVKNQLDRANKGFNGFDAKFMNYLSGVGVTDTWGVPNPYFVVSGHVNPATGADRERTHLRASTNQWPDFPRLNYRGTEYIYYEGMNTLVYDFIRNGHFTKRVGIIMTDFPGGGLIERIICINYPKTDPLCQRLPPCEGPLCR